MSFYLHSAASRAHELVDSGRAHASAVRRLGQALDRDSFLLRPREAAAAISYENALLTQLSKLSSTLEQFASLQSELMRQVEESVIRPLEEFRYMGV